MFASPQLTCLLVDDHPPLRQGVRLALESSFGVEVIGEAATAEDGLRAIASDSPDVAIVDYQLPGMNGIELIASARSDGLSLPIVLLSAHGERGLLERAFAAGANGYVAKESDLSVLEAALRVVVNGDGRYVDPTVAAKLLMDDGEKLTDRELEVLGMMSVGLQNKGIAFELKISEETAKTHVATIMRKLDATNRTQAVATALRSNMID